MNMPKISVIVPVYGVEKYIERCARSLFEQSLDDIEYIFVDDCSPDKSISILRTVLNEYPQRISSVTIMRHDKNKGLPAARKTGIKAATGAYVIQCDSDDWIDSDLYEKLYLTAMKDNSDVAICGCIETNGVNPIGKKPIGKNIIASECITDMLHEKMWWSLCNKLYKRDLFKEDLLYPQDGMGEDMCLTMQLFLHAKKVSYVHDKYYYYYVNPTSIVHLMSVEQYLSKFNQLCRNIQLIELYYKLYNINTIYKKGIAHLQFKAKYQLHPLLGIPCYYSLFRTSFPKADYVVAMDSKTKIKERIVAFMSLIGLFPLPRNKYDYLIEKKTNI